MTEIPGKFVPQPADENPIVFFTDEAKRETTFRAISDFLNREETKRFMLSYGSAYSVDFKGYGQRDAEGKQKMGHRVVIYCGLQEGKVTTTGLTISEETGREVLATIAQHLVADASIPPELARNLKQLKISKVPALHGDEHEELQLFCYQDYFPDPPAQI